MASKHVVMANRLNEFAGLLPFEQREVPAAASKMILDLGEELVHANARIDALIRRLQIETAKGTT